VGYRTGYNQNQERNGAADGDERALAGIIERLQANEQKLIRMRQLFAVAAGVPMKSLSAPTNGNWSAPPVEQEMVLKKCSRCHTGEGEGVEKFALDLFPGMSPEALREQRARMIDAVLSKEMPPEPATFDAGELEQFMRELYGSD